MKILIVDDSAPVRRMIRSLLNNIAKEIFECNDGDQVMDIYNLHNPDWVLMDIKMQNMNGLKATELLIKNFPAAKVLIVTNYAADDFEDAAKASGAYGFFSKEDLNLVIEVIKNH